MDVLGELESLANKTVLPGHQAKPSDQVIQQYMDLFSMSKEEALQKIQEIHHLLPEKKEHASSGRAVAYLVKLEAPLATPETVQHIIGDVEAPAVVTGTDESGQRVQFCRLNEKGRQAISTHFKTNRLGNAPTFLQLTQAAKSLSSYSAAPFLGLDATLPQHRLGSGEVYRPLQDEYPVWYFAYGPLTNADELAVILNTTEEPTYRAAVVHHARLLSANAISGGDLMERVLGKAFLVDTAEKEESLRFSVTDKFEVVRCRITFGEGGVTGASTNALTFRYIGHDL